MSGPRKVLLLLTVNVSDVFMMPSDAACQQTSHGSLLQLDPQPAEH